MSTEDALLRSNLSLLCSNLAFNKNATGNISTQVETAAKSGGTLLADLKERDRQALLYIVVVLLFYSVGTIVAIVMYLKREREEIDEELANEEYENIRCHSDLDHRSRRDLVQRTEAYLQQLRRETVARLAARGAVDATTPQHEKVAVHWLATTLAISFLRRVKKPASEAAHKSIGGASKSVASQSITADKLDDSHIELGVASASSAPECSGTQQSEQTSPASRTASWSQGGHIDAEIRQAQSGARPKTTGVHKSRQQTWHLTDLKNLHRLHVNNTSIKRKEDMYRKEWS